MIENQKNVIALKAAFNAIVQLAESNLASTQKLVHGLVKLYKKESKAPLMAYIDNGGELDASNVSALNILFKGGDQVPLLAYAETVSRQIKAEERLLEVTFASIILLYKSNQKKHLLEEYLKLDFNICNEKKKELMALGFDLK